MSRPSYCRARAALASPLLLLGGVVVFVALLLGWGWREAVWFWRDEIY